MMKPDIDRAVLEQGMLRPEVYNSLRQSSKKRTEIIFEDSRKIVLMVLREHIINSIFWSLLIDSLESEIKRCGFQFSLCVVDEADALIPDKEDGYVLLGNIPKKNSQALLDAHKPLVWVDADTKYDRYNQVRVNNCYGAYQMTKRAIELGHRRMVCLFFTNHLSYYERYQGMKDCVYDFRNTGAMCERIEITGSPETDAIAELLSRKSPPTFIMTCTDSLAYAVYAVAEQLLIDIPRSLSIAGFDNLHESKLVTPRLSSIDVPRVDMAIAAVHLLIKHMDNPMCSNELIQVEPTLLFRESMAEAPRNRL